MDYCRMLYVYMFVTNTLRVTWEETQVLAFLYAGLADENNQ